jgi:hypothetical protein
VIGGEDGDNDTGIAEGTGAGGTETTDTGNGSSIDLVSNEGNIVVDNVCFF